MSLPPPSVTITDDTMREGLQIESASIPVDAKLRLLDALGETGAKVISIGSFAHPKWTPQMACIEEIAERFVPRPGIRYTAAVFNKAGYDRADRFFPKIDVRKRHRLPQRQSQQNKADQRAEGGQKVAGKYRILRLLREARAARRGGRHGLKSLSAYIQQRHAVCSTPR